MAKAYINIYEMCIGKNYDDIAAYIGDDKVKKMCVLKANGYGLGAVRCARILEDHKVDYFAVATVSEAVELRTHGITTPIMILGYTDESDFDLLIQNDITQSIYDSRQVSKFNACAEGHNKTAKIHIKIETGLGRLGFNPNNKTIEIIKNLKTFRNLHVEGIFTNFACADNQFDDYTQIQLDRFNHFIRRLKLENISIDIKHAANSGAILNFKETYLDMVRIGIILYGMYPTGKDEYGLRLRKTFSVGGELASVKVIDKGQRIGYGGKFTTENKMKIAVLPMGYVDGIPKKYEEGGQVLVKGEVCNIIGGICMDQMIVDVSSIDDVDIGDEFVIVGKQGENEITLEDMARLGCTNVYEVVSRLGSRLERIYI